MISIDSFSKLHGLLRKFDSATLSKLVGSGVVEILNEFSNTGTERKLAECLLHRFGDRILESKSVRNGIVDQLDVNLAKKFVAQLDIQTSASAHFALRNHFKNWNAQNSKQFLDLLDLSEELGFRKKLPKPSAVGIVSLEYGEKISSLGQLHPYQRTVKDQVNRQLFINEGRRCLVQMPTGAGKTFTMLESVIDVLRKNPKSLIFWIVDSTELARQSHEAFNKLWKQKGDRGVFTYRFYEAQSPAAIRENGGIAFGTFSTVYSILSGGDSDEKATLDEVAAIAHTLVIDEAHSSPAATYDECITYFSRANDDLNVVGLSATPGRALTEDMERLQQLFQGNIVQVLSPQGVTYPNIILELQNEGYLAELKVEALDTGVSTAANREAEVCKELAKDKSRNKKILDILKRYVEQQKSTLLFACTLDHVFALYVLCKSENLNCEFIVGETPSATREDILKRFKNKDFLILINLDILQAGVDVPSLDHVLITRPVGSAVMYSQIIGRALRGPKNGGKELNEITTLVDNLTNFGDEHLLFKKYWEAWGID